MEFRWIEWNVEHVRKHGVSPEEADEVVAGATRPFPDYMGDGKWLVRGRTQSGRMLQVVYVLDDDETVFIIHTRPLTDGEKRRYRRRIR